MIKIGYLKDTVVFFVSDHGNNMAGIYNIFQFEDYVLETILGTWFMLLPKKNWWKIFGNKSYDIFIWK